MKKYFSLFFLVSLTALFIASCDNRKTFIEVDGLIADTVATKNPQIAFTGDSVKKVEQNNPLKVDFTMQIKNGLSSEKFNITAKLLSNNQGVLSQGANKLEYFQTKNLQGNSFAFSFEPATRDIAIYELEFTVENQRKLQTIQKLRIRYVDDLATVIIDNSIAIDQDSAKVGTNYDFNVKLVGKTARFIEFGEQEFDFFVVNVGGSTSALAGNRTQFQPDETKKIRAIPKMTARFTNQTSPFVHKSLFTPIKVLVISNVDNLPETGVNINLTLFDNLPPLPPTMIVNVFGSGTPSPKEARVSIAANAMDRDAKWGGTVVSGRFVGYENMETVQVTVNGIATGQTAYLVQFVPSLPTDPFDNCLPAFYENRFGYLVPSSGSVVVVPKAPAYIDLYSSATGFQFFSHDTPQGLITFYPYLKDLYEGNNGGNGETCSGQNPNRLALRGRFVTVDNEGAISTEILTY